MGALTFAREALFEIRTKLVQSGWRLPALGAVPAAVCLGTVYWMVESYVASIGLRSVQLLSIGFALAAFAGLSAVSVGRMTHFLLRPARRPKLVFGLEIHAKEARAVLAFGLFLGIFLVGAALAFAIDALTASAFFVQGSGAMERLVGGATQALVAVASLYVLARLTPMASAAAIGTPGIADVWTATDEDAGALLALVWLLPALVIAIAAAPVLWLLGALPFPAQNDLAGAQALLAQLRSWAVIPAFLWLWASLVLSWTVMSIGLAIAHERLLPDAHIKSARMAAASVTE